MFQEVIPNDSVRNHRTLFKDVLVSSNMNKWAKINKDEEGGGGAGGKEENLLPSVEYFTSLKKLLNN